MAKQSGPQFITGTVAGICFYQLNGRYYARKKSSLSRKRVKNDPKFANTRRYAGYMATASQLAAAVYRSLPREQRKHALYRALTGQALQLLKEGLDEAAIRERLQQDMIKTGDAAKQRKPLLVLPGKAVVRMVWQKGGKVVVEMKERLVARDGGGILRWRVIRGDELYEVDVSAGRCRSLSYERGI